MQNMDVFIDFLQSFTWDSIIKTGLRVILVLIIAWIITKLLRNFLRRLEIRLLKKSREEGEPASESGKRIETLIRLLRQAAMLALWMTSGLIILKELNVDIAPIIASAGIAGLAVGFGAQNLVRDIISGFFIILENQIRVGDVATINGTGGLVEQINFRTIVLRDLAGVVHIFPNGTITTLSNLTNEWSAYVIEIGVAYKENLDRVIELMQAVGRDMLSDRKFGRLMLEEPEIFGVDRLGDSAVIIKGRIKTKPIRQWEIGREYLRRLKLIFDKNNIEIPFPHRTIYAGEISKPFAVKLQKKLFQENSS